MTLPDPELGELLALDEEEVEEGQHPPVERTALVHRGCGQLGDQPALLVPVQRGLYEAGEGLFHGKMRRRGEQTRVDLERQVCRRLRGGGVGQAGGQARFQPRPMVSAHQLGQLGEQERLEGAHARLLPLGGLLQLVDNLAQLLLLYEDEGPLVEVTK